LYINAGAAAYRSIVCLFDYQIILYQTLPVITYRFATMAMNNHALNEIEKSYLERLERLESTAPVTMSRQEYERLYLTPKPPVKGDLRKRFANPTPL
jgi:hypothetical protein